MIIFVMCADGGTAVGFVNSLVDLVGSFHGEEDQNIDDGLANRLPSKKVNEYSSDDINRAASILLDAMTRSTTESGGQKLRKLIEEDGRETGSDTAALIPTPIDCSVWRKNCETSLDGLLFDETCKATKIVENGCPREDITYELLVNMQ